MYVAHILIPIVFAGLTFTQTRWFYMDPTRPRSEIIGRHLIKLWFAGLVLAPAVAGFCHLPLWGLLYLTIFIAGAVGGILGDIIGEIDDSHSGTV